MRLVHFMVAAGFKLWNRQLEVSSNVKIDPRAFIARGGRVALGNSVLIRAGAMLLPSGGWIRVGDHSSINQYTVINGEGGVEIGRSVLIAAFVSIFAANHIFEDPDKLIREQGMATRGGICIEDDVWIGTHAVILDGIKIGKGSVVAAGAVVTKDVAPYSVVAGTPARLIRKRGARKSAFSRSQPSTIENWSERRTAA